MPPAGPAGTCSIGGIPPSSRRCLRTPPLSRRLSRPLCISMPKKGKAFEKPHTNAAFKSAKVAQARALAAAEGTTGDELLQDLASQVGNAKLSIERARQALMVIKVAVKKLRAGEDPLANLMPPADCGPCHGNHEAHHFLCLKRKEEPPGAEKPLRRAVLKILRNARRDDLYSRQTVRASSRQPSHALVPSRRQAGTVRVPSSAA